MFLYLFYAKAQYLWTSDLMVQYRCWCPINQLVIQKQPPRGVFKKRCTENMQQIYRHGCSPVNLLHIFRTPFPSNTSEWLLQVILKNIYDIWYIIYDILLLLLLLLLYNIYIYNHLNDFDRYPIFLSWTFLFQFLL